MRYAIELEGVPGFPGDVTHRLRELLKRALRNHGLKCRTCKPVEEVPPKPAADKPKAKRSRKPPYDPATVASFCDPGEQPATDGYFPRLLLNGEPDDGVAF